LKFELVPVVITEPRIAKRYIKLKMKGYIMKEEFT